MYVHAQPHLDALVVEAVQVPRFDHREAEIVQPAREPAREEVEHVNEVGPLVRLPTHQVWPAIPSTQPRHHGPGRYGKCSTYPSFFFVLFSGRR